MNTPRLRDKLQHILAEATEALEELEALTPEQEPPPRVMTLEAYAKRKGAKKRTVQRWVEFGMPVERRGKIVRVVVAEADKWDYDAARARHAETAAARGRQPPRRGRARRRGS